MTQAIITEFVVASAALTGEALAAGVDHLVRAMLTVAGLWLALALVFSVARAIAEPNRRDPELR